MLLSFILGNKSQSTGEYDSKSSCKWNLQSFIILFEHWIWIGKRKTAEIHRIMTGNVAFSPSLGRHWSGAGRRAGQTGGSDTKVSCTQISLSDWRNPCFLPHLCKHSHVIAQRSWRNHSVTDQTWALTVFGHVQESALWHSVRRDGFQTVLNTHLIHV